MLSFPNTFLRKSQLTGILEYICQGIDLTASQFANAKKEYEEVGLWLAESGTKALANAVIYPQGSLSIQTVVKPLLSDEYDVDLVCHIPQMTPHTAPQHLKRLIGDRLKQCAQYKDRLEEKPRCWRLISKNKFHMDITPSIANPQCDRGGELVPDKVLQMWKTSNPRGYQGRFNHYAEMQPNLLLGKVQFDEARAQVEKLPLPTKFKGILRRTTQLCKRHRDVMFCETDPHLAPISIIITSLAAWSYKYCVQKNTYETEIDVFLDVVKHLPDFIEKKLVEGKERHYIWNETTIGENFAEKWNVDPRLADAFYRWHEKAMADFERISRLDGLDVIQHDLALSFGKKLANDAMMISLDKFETARNNKSLVVVQSLGLTIGVTSGTSVLANTFFGEYC